MKNSSINIHWLIMAIISTLIFAVPTGQQVLAQTDACSEVIIHYQRPDGDYEEWALPWLAMLGGAALVALVGAGFALADKREQRDL